MNSGALCSTFETNEENMPSSNPNSGPPEPRQVEPVQCAIIRMLTSQIK